MKVKKILLIVSMIVLFTTELFATAPTVTSTAVTTGAKDTLYSYTLNASDADGDNLTWSETAGTTLPNWLTLLSSEPNINTIAGTLGTGGATGDGGLATSATLNNPTGVAVDSSGNIYIADRRNHAIRKVDTSGNISTVAGTLGTSGDTGDGGLATSATLNSPMGVDIDSNGNIYIVDNGNNVIRKVDTNGNISTIAGTLGTGGATGDGGLATNATLSIPHDVALDTSGNIYISDYGNSAIRKVDILTGNISTIAGTLGTTGATGDGGLATSATLNSPTSVVVDTSGNIYISDFYNHAIRKVDTSGNISTIAGTLGTSGATGDGGLATSATLNRPYGVTIDSTGNIYIVDKYNQAIRKVDVTSGNISTIAGTLGTSGTTGDGDIATRATLKYPGGLALDTNGNIYIADYANNAIRKIDNSSITTLSGTPTDSNGATSSQDVNLTLSDGVNNVLHNFTITLSGFNESTTFSSLSEITTDDNTGAVNPFAGLILTDTDSTEFTATIILDDNDKGTLSSTSISSGTLSEVQSAIQAITFTPTENRVIAGGRETTTITVSISADGNDDNTTNTVISTSVNDTPTIEGTAVTTGAKDTLYSYTLNASDADRDNLTWSVTAGTTLPNWLTLLSSEPNINTIAGTLGTSGDTGDGGLATDAKLNSPREVAFDSSGNIYIADSYNHVIRKIDTSGNISTIAGTLGSFGNSGDGGSATDAKLKKPSSIAVDSSGNIYIADTFNQVIRKIDTSGNISTIVGTGSSGSTGDGGSAISATLNYPMGVAVDASGNIYIADNLNHAIRKVDISSGIITTVAGTLGTSGATGDGGLATSATLYKPMGVAVDVSGNIYIADNSNHAIRKVDISSGNISTIAGTLGSEGYTGDGGLATDAKLKEPAKVAIDSNGNIYIADKYNQAIRKVDTNGNISTIAGTGIIGSTGDGGSATSATLNYPSGLAVDSNGNVYIAEANNHTIRKIDNSAITTLSGTPTDSNGATASQDVNLTLSDGVNNVSHNFTITLSGYSATILTISINKGTITDSTKITYTPSTGHTLKYMYSNSSVDTPTSGDSTPLGAIAYTSGDDISSATTGNYLIIYEVDSNGNIVGFTQHQLVSDDINIDIDTDTETIPTPDTNTTTPVITVPSLKTTIPDQLVDVNNTALFDTNLSSYFTNATTYSFQEVKTDNNISDWLSIDSSNGKFSINTDDNISILGKYFIKAIASGGTDTNATGYFTLRVKDLNASLSDYITSTGITGAVNNTGDENGKQYAETNATISGQDISVKVYDDGSSKHSIDGRSEATSMLPDSKVKIETNGDVNTSATTINNSGDEVLIEVLAIATGDIKATHTLEIDGVETKAISNLSNTVTIIRIDRSIETNATVGSTAISVLAQPSGNSQHTVTKGGKTSKATVSIAGGQTVIDTTGTVTTTVDTNITAPVGRRFEAVAITNENGKTITKFRELDMQDGTTEYNPNPTLANGESFPQESDVNITKVGNVIHIQTLLPVLTSETKFNIE